MSNLKDAINEINKELRELGEDAKTASESLVNALVSLIDSGSHTRSEWVQDIADMHHKFGVNEVVTNFNNEKLLKFLEFRLNFLQEELDEAKAALQKLNMLQTVHPEVDNVSYEQISTATVEAADDIVDAMIDLCVVAIGTLDAFEVDADEAWNRVHAANMMKAPGVKPERPNPLGLPDLIKPEGWVAPSHSDNIGLLEKLT